MSKKDTAINWLKGHKSKRSYPPFPTNPYFTPQPPISNFTKQSMYDLYLKDPQKNSPRQLAQLYKISIERTMAILRLKALEKSNKENNIPIQIHLTQGMEKLLGSKTIYPDQKEKYESLRSSYASRIIPFFKFTDESDSFTPDDAAVLMNKDPWMTKIARLNKKADRLFEKENELIPEPISQEVHQKGKCDFMIVDTSSNQQFIRDKQGILRPASAVEKVQKLNAHKREFIMQ